MKKAIIFDLDGTLWDSSASVCESWNIVFSRYPEITRRLTPADVQGFMGKTLDQIFPIALPDTPDELRRKALNECVHYELEYIAEHGGRLYPKLRETLVDAQELRAHHRQQLPGRLYTGLPRLCGYARAVRRFRERGRHGAFQRREHQAGDRAEFN